MRLAVSTALLAGCLLTCVTAATVMIKDELVRGEACEPRYLRTLANSHMIDTTDTNYAITSMMLAKNNWNSVAVNGDDVVIYMPNCQVIRQPLNSLSNEQKALITAARSQLIDVRTGKPKSTQVRSVQYLVNDTIYTNSAQNPRLRGSSSIRIHDINGLNYAVYMAAFPVGLVRVFRIQDAVVFVYGNKRVDMKPIECLEAAEERFFTQFRLNLEEVEALFKRTADYKINIGDDIEHSAQRLKIMHSAMRRVVYELGQECVEIKPKFRELEELVSALKTEGEMLVAKTLERKNMSSVLEDDLNKLSDNFMQNMKGLL